MRIRPLDATHRLGSGQRTAVRPIARARQDLKMREIACVCRRVHSWAVRGPAPPAAKDAKHEAAAIHRDLSGRGP